MSQEGYVQDLIKAYDVNGRAQSPAGENLFSVNEDAEKLSKSETETFHSKTAKFLYLSKRTRPDILTAVVFLTTRVLNPDVDDARKLDRVLKYVDTTQELALTRRGALLPRHDFRFHSPRPGESVPRRGMYKT